MDVEQGKVLMVDFFRENDIYNPNINFRNLNFNILKINDSDPLPQEWEIKIAVQAVINEMISEGILKLVEIKNSKTLEQNYIIVNSLKNNGCIVELSKQCAVNVAAVVSSILPLIDININYQPSPYELSEQDIHLLLQAIQLLSGRLQSLENNKNNKDTKNSRTDEEN